MNITDFPEEYKAFGLKHNDGLFRLAWYMTPDKEDVDTMIANFFDLEHKHFCQRHPAVAPLIQKSFESWKAESLRSMREWHASYCSG